MTGHAMADPVTLQMWTNATADPLKGIFQKAADDYHAAHSDVTIQITPIQNEQFTTKIPLALSSDNPPDIYFNQGAHLLADQSQSGKVADITDSTKSWIGDVGTAAGNWTVDGKQMGIPYTMHVVGFWYRKDLFEQAGITGTPATMKDLNDDIAKLKAKGIAPIALGGKDRWPDAFYYDIFALRLCDKDTMKTQMAAGKLEDKCFTDAGQATLDFVKSAPFQDGFNGTPAQQGPGSSAGLVANGKAAMELQGTWDLGVMTGLTDDKSLADKIGWFPFPAVEGGKGDPTAALGGGDGFACTTNAHVDMCADFLHFLSSKDIQESMIKAGVITIPVVAAASEAIALPVLQQVVDFNGKAAYVQTYFDLALTTAQGQALDDAAANLFGGQGGATAVADAVNAAQ
jgi:raffinose/stachyose/melibiose transport system substrate-binding protein